MTTRDEMLDIFIEDMTKNPTEWSRYPIFDYTEDAHTKWYGRSYSVDQHVLSTFKIKKIGWFSNKTTLYFFARIRDQIDIWERGNGCAVVLLDSILPADSRYAEFVKSMAVAEKLFEQRQAQEIEQVQLEARNRVFQFFKAA
jgi:hypothetical protein